MTRKPAGWPDDVEPLSIEEFEKLGINARSELFWDGHRLITRSKFYLTLPQTLLAFLAAVASIATVATGLNNAAVFLCARDVHWLGCPAPSAALRPLPAPQPTPTPAPPVRLAPGIRQ
ncbi:MAG: hypothetical protein JO264_21095 [Acidisphaera sp.]|nr:hypothetical protein [Acidisphaera sp.]